MKNIIITDAKYRASLATVHALAKKEYNIILCQTDDYKKTPCSFKSKYVKRAVILHDENYAEELLKLIREYERPVVLPIGAKTTELLSKNSEIFKVHCDFLVPSPKALDNANDKKTASLAAEELNIPIPKKYNNEPDTYPVIIKPSCGEKFGLHAEQRYSKANNREEYLAALEEMKKYDPQPIIQEYIEGNGIGVCVVMNREQEAVGLICHQRIRELPISGGPSTCCKTIYDKQLIEYSIALLKKLDFCGVAMVEFKGGRFLEINPRVWGSFPLTYKSKSNFTQNWVKCAANEKTNTPKYQKGIKMNFVVNDTLAAFKYLISGKPGKFFGAIGDILNPLVKEALFSYSDPKPFFQYIANLF